MFSIHQAIENKYDVMQIEAFSLYRFTTIKRANEPMVNETSRFSKFEKDSKAEAAASIWS